MVYKKGVLEDFTKFAGKRMCQNLFFNKVVDLFKKRLWHRCSPVIFSTFLGTLFFIERLCWLLLIKHRTGSLNGALLIK